MSLTNTLRGRWNPAWDNHSALEGLKTMFENSLNFTTAPALQKADIAKPGTLSQKGVTQALRAKMASHLAPELRRYKKTIADQEAALEAEAADLAKPKVDKADVLAELQRQEIRSWLRSMDEGTRFATLVSCEEPSITEAALSALPALSGLNPRSLPDVQASYVRTKYADRLADIEDRSEALTLARITVEMAENALQEEVGLSGRAFSEWFETGRDPDAVEAA